MPAPPALSPALQLLLRKLQGTKGTVAKLQGKVVPAPGGGRAGVFGATGGGYQQATRAAMAAEHMASRPGWVDSTSGSRPPESAMVYGEAGGAGGAGAARTGRIFKSLDPRDVALSACPDRHTLM